MQFSRADFVVNLTYAATLIAPLIALLSFRLARRRRHDVHRALQIALLTFCWLTVLAFEVQIRLAGGSGAFLDQAPVAWQWWARGLLLVHISLAVATYGLWTWLAIVSSRRLHQRLPGSFSRRHRRLGWAVFGGLCVTGASATGMYMFAFVL
jgi:putative membrane protein